MLSCRPVAILLLSACAAFAELRAGRAQLSIVGELMVKVLVLDDGETRAAMAICDLASLDVAAVMAARKRIAAAGAAASSIPEFNIMIAVTGARGARVPDSAPPGHAAARIAEAVRLASASLQPVSVWAGLGREDAIGFYDRFLMKDGSVRANPGKLDPDIVQPAGEADPELTVARFESLAGGQTLALFGSFSLRAAVIDAAHQSPDYPGVIARTLAKLHGPDLVTLWSTGAGANVTHLDVRNALPQQGPAEARRVGTVLAGEAIKAGARAGRIGAAKLGVARETIKLAAAKAGQPGIEVEVQAIALGTAVAWVALPGELWSELGTAVRKASPFSYTLLVGSANGSAGVLPGRKGYAAGSALEPGVIAAVGSGETVAGAAARLLAAARRQSAGQP